MAHFYDVLSSSDDEEILQQINRRERKFKVHINFFEELDGIEFKMRFRLSKESILLILENITEELEFLTNK